MKISNTRILSLTISYRIILAFAGFHIYLAATLPLPFVIYYVCALLIPIFLFAVALFLIKENNQNWSRTKIHGLRVWWSTRSDKKKQDPEQGQQEGEDNNNKASTETQIYSPYKRTLSLHLHHWQIFYMLAFFTR